VTLILGIDPGRQGAFALYDTEEQTVECHDMPDTIAGLHDLVAGFPAVKVCALEKPYYPASIGTANAAKIGEAFGALRGALVWKDIPFREVRPAEWKKAMNLTSVKGVSRNVACNHFPDSADLFKRVKDDGRAEAALLAVYAQRWRA